MIFMRVEGMGLLLEGGSLCVFRKRSRETETGQANKDIRGDKN